METVKKKWKKNMVVKAWERCCKTRSSSISSNTTHAGVAKAAPEGCLPVYVGPQRQRFVIKTEFANHPLFRMLLQGAELEYGFSNEGPLLLPCDVDMFKQVLAEIHSGDQQILTPLCTPSPRRSSFNKGYYGSYQLPTPS
ncbi:hypothetical protein Goari_007152 [Gossypium aridum]|uniref:Uncharacterized protein n=1 Tax=Gossypium aridum TaxID=34290 RepID=A0A7J8XQC0_GOSAI|nr:hypothetical protein [Gossypium aridum]